MGGGCTDRTDVRGYWCSTNKCSTNVCSWEQMFGGTNVRTRTNVQPVLCRYAGGSDTYIIVYRDVWFCWWVWFVVGAVARLPGERIMKGLFSTPPVALSVSRPLFHDAAHVDLLFCRPRGFVPLSFSYPDVRGFYALGYESSTHVPVCEARPVQRGYANRMSDGLCGQPSRGGVSSTACVYFTRGARYLLRTCLL